jgi:hypothetical protein
LFAVLIVWHQPLLLKETKQPGTAVNLREGQDGTGPEQTSPQPPTKTTVRTRGGVTEHNVRYVLAFGLAGVIIAFIVIAIYFSRLSY